MFFFMEGVTKYLPAQKNIAAGESVPVILMWN